MSKRFVSIGECMIEMSGGESGTYQLGYAGDTLNTAWYARALLPADWQVEYVTALGDDHYSAQMLRFFADHGIVTSHIRRIVGRRPGLYLIHQDGGDRHFTYWRDNSAARLLADDEAALDAALEGADLVYFSGITLAILGPRARGKLLKAIIKARDGGARVAFDPNHRLQLWTSAEVMRSALTVGAGVADIVLPTYTDEAPTFGDEDAQATARRYLSLGAAEVVVKNGGADAIVAAGADMHAAPAPEPPALVDTTGAGDSFNGAYLAGRLAGGRPRDCAEAAHRLAGVVIGHRGALVAPDQLPELRLLSR